MTVNGSDTQDDGDPFVSLGIAAADSTGWSLCSGSETFTEFTDSVARLLTEPGETHYHLRARQRGERRTETSRDPYDNNGPELTLASETMFRGRGADHRRHGGGRSGTFDTYGRGGADSVFSSRVEPSFPLYSRPDHHPAVHRHGYFRQCRQLDPHGRAR